MNIPKNSKKHKFWLRGLIGFLFGMSLIALLSHFTTFIVSETDSLPYHYFLNVKTSPVKWAYTNVYSLWYKGNIVKQIIGTENDKVFYDGEGALWVNDFKVGVTKPQASDGRALTPIKAQTIPKGFVFLYSPHDRSFDSRYQELGLIPLSMLRGRLIPIC